MPRAKKDPYAGPTIRMAGVLEEGAGWRVIVSEVPLVLAQERAVARHEPDLRMIAEARVLVGLWDG